MNQWKSLAALLYCFFSFPSFAATTDVTTYIVNGTSTSVTTYGSFVSLFYDRIEYDGVYGVGSFCGATMLDATHVLTAAHCIFDGSGNLDENYMLFTVVVQTDNEAAFPNGNIEKVRASEFYYHPGYEDSSTNLWPNDIAIIKLESGLNVVSYATLPSDENYRKGDTDANDYTFQAVGHGNTSTGVDDTNDLEVTNLSYVSISTCQSDLPAVTSKQICFKGASTDPATGLDSGTCQGDSGGPVYWNFGGSLTQVGLVSFGPSTCGVGTTAGITSVFTNVYSYSSWINSVLSGAVTPNFVANDEKRANYTGFTTSTNSDSSGGSMSAWMIASLFILALRRYRFAIHN
ncbi:trypsin-like serine protease [Vibrio fluvialis]|uniref:trypsin-like serine protease n=1 Tax=Vibrio fluvialis TaxID=676 RepID=UPI0005C9FE74|nr:trypsin-like serine protease [Vibrio fluvialis]ELI5731751.1 trypsin-like serine protease [Vibrio fluvialis]MBY7973541.1 trypsin-like serine protease [Vibrio fluvialis]MBY8085870.1 trypsin-like serine protease [Vibrio fluvialis]